MYINDEKKTIFLCHPRTGSRAVSKALVDWCGFKAQHSHHAGPQKGEYEDYFKFTTVRNHWDAITSWWYNAVGQSSQAQLTVPWVRKWFKGNANYFRLPRLWWFLGEFPDIHVMRYETLLEDYHNTLGSRGCSPTKLPMVGYGTFRKSRPYQEVVTPEVRAFIQETFADEIEELGYTY